MKLRTDPFQLRTDPFQLRTDPFQLRTDPFPGCYPVPDGEPTAGPANFGKTGFSALVGLENVGYILYVMQTFHAETVVEKDGKLHLDHVPFSEGQAVHVVVSSATPV